MRSRSFSWQYSLAATLLLLSPFDLLASLAMDMYLPVLPQMADELRATPTQVQFTLTLYLMLLGAGQLLFGPLSDRFGRRPVLCSGAVAFGVASIALALASSPAAFLGWRVVQACGASACLVATFATVRDVYAGREESHVIYGMLGAMLAVVPAVGPLLGALVDAWLGWRAIFALLALAMLAALLSAWWFWPETRRQQESTVSWAQLVVPLKSRHFWLFTLCYSAGMGSFFVFFSTAPWLMMDRHGLSQSAFSLWFASVALVMLLTAKTVGRLAPRWGTLTSLRIAMAILIVGAGLLAGGELLLPATVLGFVLPMWVVGIGIAMAVAVAPNGALRGFDDMAGAATAVYFCLGGVLLGGLGTLIVIALPAQQAWPVVTYCAALPVVVLVMARAGAAGVLAS